MSNKMRILHIISQHWRLRQCVELVKRINKSRFDVTLNLQQEGPLCNEVMDAEIPLKEIKSGSFTFKIPFQIPHRIFIWKKGFHNSDLWYLIIFRNLAAKIAIPVSSEEKEN
jgi:hypothetical protein